MSYIPKYINQTANKQPGDIVQAARWNELFNLLIVQGDYNAEVLDELINGTDHGIGAQFDHTQLSNIGVNTHAQIDTALTRLADTSGTNTGDQDLSALALKSNVLEKDNTTPYTPTADYHPLTLKYFVDNAGGGGVTDHTLLTNIGVNTHAQIDTDLLRLANTSGTNTGDQDLSALALKSNVLELDNTDVYTPTMDYHPATKKYADENGVTDHTLLTNIGTNTHAQIDAALAKFENNLNKTMEPTGFTNNENIGVSYDSTTRRVTLTGTFEAYYKGELVPTLTNGWVSDPHTDAEGRYFLYYNGTSVVWSTTPWEFTDMMICYVQYNINGVTNLALREVHGLMPWQSHREFHETVGTYKTAGADLSDYTLSSTTDKQPDISVTTVRDEDLTTNIPAKTDKLYTHRYLVGAAVRTFDTDNTHILPVVGNVPYWNENVGGTWQQTAFANNEYGAVFVVAIPVTSDTESQKYNYVFMQPQQVGILAVINQLTPNDVYLGDIGGVVSEYVFVSKIIVRAQSGNWYIHSVEALTGTRNTQITSPAGNYLTVVNSDATLNGEGTAASPLSVEPSEISHNSLSGVEDADLGALAGHITPFAQTIFGVKEFDSLPESSGTPTTANQLTNKAYVDSKVVATDIPSFRVNLSANQMNVSSGTKFAFDTVSYDVGNNFNTSTNTYVIPTTGKYSFSAQVTAYAVVTNDRYGYSLRVNGTERAGTRNGATSTSAVYADQTVELQLTAGDEVTLHASADSTVSYLSDSSYTFWSGRMIPDETTVVQQTTNTDLKYCKLTATQTTGQTAPNGTGFVVNFETAQADTDGFWSAGTPSRITIPNGSGITKVELTGSLLYVTNSNGTRYASIWKNGADVIGGGRNAIPATGGGVGGYHYLGVSSSIIEVQEGDYFELRGFQDSGSTLTLHSTNPNGTFISLKVLEVA